MIIPNPCKAFVHLEHLSLNINMTIKEHFLKTTVAITFGFSAFITVYICFCMLYTQNRRQNSINANGRYCRSKPLKNTSRGGIEL